MYIIRTFRWQPKFRVPPALYRQAWTSPLARETVAGRHTEAVHPARHRQNLSHTAREPPIACDSQSDPRFQPKNTEIGFVSLIHLASVPSTPSENCPATNRQSETRNLQSPPPRSAKLALFRIPAPLRRPGPAARVAACPNDSEPGEWNLGTHRPQPILRWIHDEPHRGPPSAVNVVVQ